MNQEQLTIQITNQAKAARQASRALRVAKTTDKNQALLAMAQAIRDNQALILAANAQDLAGLGDISVAFRNRLTLTAAKIVAMADGVESVATLEDPVGKIVDGKQRPNGLRIHKIRIPIGVIACIFESRPNVVADIAALAIKSGNACMLRGGKEALQTNRAIVKIIHEALNKTTISPEVVQFIAQTEHEAVPLIASLAEYIDLIIPRGGEGLIDAVCKHARMPVLQHRKGVTHMFIDESARETDALAIVKNGKISNPSACNSLEHVVVHHNCASNFVPKLVSELIAAGVEVRGCEKTQALDARVLPASETDFAGEYLDLIITIKIVTDFAEAITEIQTHSTGLADGIITQSLTNAEQFVTMIDSAVTYVNASTRFTDGSEFGLGAEVGISTAKIHGMGPMGVEDLTVTKYTVYGTGQIRV